METYKELDKLGLFDWVEKNVNTEDSSFEFYPDDLDDLPIDCFDKTIINAIALRWFREKHNIDGLIHKTIEGDYYFWITSVGAHEHYQYYDKKKLVYYNNYCEAEYNCINTLIQIVKNK